MAKLRYREVLGHYPTGVVVVTARDETGEPVGMTIGSFTSVSLDPPLVAFLPTRDSRTFARLRTASSFCVNVLAADQDGLCRRFAVPGEDRFQGVEWTPAPSGAPVLDGAVAWIDCEPHDVTEAGDHWLVLGRVTRLRVVRRVQPLLFFQGGYGRFTPTLLTAPPGTDLIRGVRLAERTRPRMEALAQELGVECSVLSPVGPDLVTVAVAAPPGRAALNTVGDRIPMRPPLGDLYVAWQDEETVVRWLDGTGASDSAARSAYRRRLDVARRRGWSMSLAGKRQEGRLATALREYSEGDLTPEHHRRVEREIAEMAEAYEPVPLEPGKRYDVRSLVAPVFGPDHEVRLVLRISQLPVQAPEATVRHWLTRLTEAAGHLSASREATASGRSLGSAR
ncbi:flavin reductase [Streptomyces sp. NPDC052042]|uniref:flavin reductase n=1 Tax=Streptomyces sp. NPDC052042 TaxID=3365683 RepID=UPI0037D583FF